jgi:hypothetical protein
MSGHITGVHPSEEQLMEFAVSGLPREIEEHAAACKACSDAIHEFREVKKHMTSCGEEPVHEHIERKILNISRHGHHGTGLARAVFSYPFFIALAVAIVVILLVFLVGSEVFRVP